MCNSGMLTKTKSCCFIQKWVSVLYVLVNWQTLIRILKMQHLLFLLWLHIDCVHSLQLYFQEIIEGKVTSLWEKKDRLNVLFDETDSSRAGLNNLVERQTEKWLTDMGAFCNGCVYQHSVCCIITFMTLIHARFPLTRNMRDIGAWMMLIMIKISFSLMHDIFNSSGCCCKQRGLWESQQCLEN